MAKAEQARRYSTDTEGIMSELILVVDDETDIRDLLVFNLKREGYETAEAADGLHALDLARSRRPQYRQRSFRP